MNIFNNIAQRWNRLIPPVRWMVYLFSGILVLSFLFAPTPSPHDYFNTDFSYTSSSKIYFNNVRSYYYIRSNEQKAGFHSYELKKQRMRAEEWPFTLLLLDNWRSEEVYINVEMDSLLVALEVDTTRYMVKAFNRDDMHAIAASVYLAVKENKIVKAVYSDSTTIVFDDRKDRKALETCLFDYFRWLDIH